MTPSVGVIATSIYHITQLLLTKKMQSTTTTTPLSPAATRRVRTYSIALPSGDEVVLTPMPPPLKRSSAGDNDCGGGGWVDVARYRAQHHYHDGGDDDDIERGTGGRGGGGKLEQMEREKMAERRHTLQCARGIRMIQPSYFPHAVEETDSDFEMHISMLTYVLYPHEMKDGPLVRKQLRDYVKDAYDAMKSLMAAETRKAVVMSHIKWDIEFIEMNKITMLMIKMRRDKKMKGNNDGDGNISAILPTRQMVKYKVPTFEEVSDRLSLLFQKEVNCDDGTDIRECLNRKEKLVYTSNAFSMVTFAIRCERDECIQSIYREADQLCKEHGLNPDFYEYEYN